MAAPVFDQFSAHALTSIARKESQEAARNKLEGKLCVVGGEWRWGLASTGAAWQGARGPDWWDAPGLGF